MDIINQILNSKLKRLVSLEFDDTNMSAINSLEIFSTQMAECTCLLTTIKDST